MVTCKYLCAGSKGLPHTCDSTFSYGCLQATNGALALPIQMLHMQVTSDVFSKMSVYIDSSIPEKLHAQSFTEDVVVLCEQ